ncbi:MAG: CdaR family protein [Candidatus Limnocylindrales bacterium]
MTRVIGAIIYNWPLKVMAIALAMLLYGALVIAQNQQSHPAFVPIQAANQPAGTIVIGPLGEVTEVSYLVRDQANVAFTSANFNATVDLAQVAPGPQTQSVRVVVQSADPRIQVLSAVPEFVSVKVERVVSKRVPVNVVPGPVPDGLDIKAPQQSIESATVRGAQSDVARVTSLRADVAIDTSGLDVDRDFPLAPIDDLGERVRGVEAEPTSVRVTMDVFKDQTAKTVPIVAVFSGDPAPGFEVVRVGVSAPVVSLQGEASDLADIVNAQTAPVSVEGRSSDLDETVAFVLPTGVTAVTPTTVQVHVVIRPVSESRTFNAGVVVIGGRADRTYTLSVPQALLTIGGSPPVLDRLSGAALVLNADVTGLDVGAHQISLAISLEAGLSIVAISPATVTVTIGLAVPASAAPSAALGG